jgi:hypothetical protein
MGLISQHKDEEVRCGVLVSRILAKLQCVSTTLDVETIQMNKLLDDIKEYNNES